MGARKVKCPGCGMPLSLPGDIGGRTVRCGACRTPFRVPAPSTSLDETITEWLNEPEEDEKQEDGDALSPQAQAKAKAKAGTGKPVATASRPGKFAPGPASSADKRPRLVSLEQRGVLVEFPADCLLGEYFRAAIPRVCVHCMARTHLSAHLVIFTSQLRDSISLEAEHKAGQLIIPQDQLGNLYGAEMLARLPEVPNVPAPGNRPMPYWVCDMCNGAGEISGQIQANSATGQGICRLHFRNVKVAEEFLANAGTKGTQDYVTVCDFLEHLEEDRWDALPSVVRHRMEQWSRPGPGERFLAYIPDRAFVRTEDGMAGLAISDQRLIYHRPPLHQEVPVSSQITFQTQLAGGKEIVSLEAQDFKKRIITLDRGGMMQLRRAVSEGKYKAVWE